MKSKYLFQWMQSKSVNRKKRAIEKLAFMCMQDKSILKDFFEALLKMVEDDVTEVRAMVYKAMYRLALKYKEVINKTLEIYKTKFSEEESLPKTIILSGIKKIIEVEPTIYDDSVRDMIQESIESEDVNLRSIGIRFLSSLIALDNDFVLNNIDNVLAAAKSDNINLMLSAFDVLKNVVSSLPEDKISEVRSAVIGALEHGSYLVRKHALTVLNNMLIEKKTEVDENVIRLIRKKLRDNSDFVRHEALRSVFIIAKDDPYLVDGFLSIIVKDYLLNGKNKNLKLSVLNYLSENIEKIPREILYRHELPRALDIIDRNTVRKNEKLSRIKDLAKFILEEKLGVTYEMRRNMR